MPYLDETEVRRKMDKRNGDHLTEIGDPVDFGDLTIWEVWVLANREAFAVRFLVEYPGKKTKTFDTVQRLINELNKRVQLPNPGEHAQARIVMGKFYVASAIAIAAVAGMLYLVVAKDNALIAGLMIFGGVIASSSVFFFGKWVMPKLPTWFH